MIQLKYIRFSANRKGLSDRDRKILNNLGLVKMLVRKFPATVLSQPGSEFDDLFSVGCIGLAKAVDRFDPNKGTQFSSFAVPYIRGEILHYLERDCYRYGIKISRNLFWDKDFRIPTLELDQSVGWDSETTWLEKIELQADNTHTYEEQDFAWWMLSQLSDKNRLILEGIYYQGLTQKQVAGRMNVSEVTIMRNKRKAIEQLQELVGRSV